MVHTHKVSLAGTKNILAKCELVVSKPSATSSATVCAPTPSVPPQIVVLTCQPGTNGYLEHTRPATIYHFACCCSIHLPTFTYHHIPCNFRIFPINQIKLKYMCCLFTESSFDSSGYIEQISATLKYNCLVKFKQSGILPHIPIKNITKETQWEVHCNFVWKFFINLKEALISKFGCQKQGCKKHVLFAKTREKERFFVLKHFFRLKNFTFFIQYQTGIMVTVVFF